MNRKDGVAQCTDSPMASKCTPEAYNRRLIQTLQTPN